MRILIAHSFYRVAGGEDRYVRQQLELLSKDNEVMLLERSNAELQGTMKTAGRMTFSMSERSRVEEAIRRFRPDIVHLHNAYPSLGPAVHLATSRLNVPLVMTVHNFRMRCPNALMFTEGLPCNRCEGGFYAHAAMHECFPTKHQAIGYATSLWAHRFIFRLERKTDLFIVPSRFMRDQLRTWGIPEDKIMLVRNFTDVDEGSSEPGEYGLYLGRMSIEKGIDDLIEALKVAGDPPFRIVGDGPLDKKVRELIADAALRNVRFVGRVQPSEVVSLLRRARFVALPSVCHENAPLAALEAMRMGRPLVVSDRGGLPELVQGGEGVVHRAHDSHDLAAKMRLLFDDDDLCRRAGELGLRRARSEFVPERHVARLSDVYSKVTAG